MRCHVLMDHPLQVAALCDAENIGGRHKMEENGPYNNHCLLPATWRNVAFDFIGILSETCKGTTGLCVGIWV